MGATIFLWYTNIARNEFGRDIAETRARMRFLFSVSKILINKVACGRIYVHFDFPFFLLGWDNAVRAKGLASAASEERGFAGVGEALYVASVLSRQGRLKTESCLDGEAQVRAMRPSGSSPGSERRSDTRFHASGGHQYTIAPVGNGIDSLMRTTGVSFGIL